jgi:hypothetical protein
MKKGGAAVDTHLQVLQYGSDRRPELNNVQAIEEQRVSIGKSPGKDLARYRVT